MFSFVEFCMNKINQLRHYRIHPIMVFDGAPLPMKEGREEERRLSRETSRQKALELLARGEREAARLHIQKAVDVTPEMAARLIVELKRAGVEYLVAPYEADAQMAYLDRRGRIAAVITEDSDLILFGCRRILYKLDREGWADEVCLERLGACEELDLAGFTLDRFRHMCILSGCDYLPSPPGMGLRTAHKYAQRHIHPERLLQAIKTDWGHRLPLSNYEQAFIRAELTFRHQVVWCPERKERVHLDPIDPSYDCPDWSFLGIREHPQAELIALGHLHPHTAEPLLRQLEDKPILEKENTPPPVVEKRSHFFADRVTVPLPLKVEAGPRGKESTLSTKFTPRIMESMPGKSIRQMSTKRGNFTFSKPVAQAMKGLPTCYYATKGGGHQTEDPRQSKLPFVKTKKK